MIPPTKKAKLSTTEDANEGSLSSPQLGDPSETTEHAQTEVAMDTNVQDERCDDQDQQWGVC